MITALCTLVFIGLVVNNLTANALTPTSTAQTCSAATLTCTLTANVGCQAAAANCNLSGSSISFLNQNSPFTALIQGNVFGFFNGLTNTYSQGINSIGATTGSGISQTTTSPFGAIGGGPYFPVNCQKSAAPGQSWASFIITGCTLVSNLGNRNFSSSTAAGAVVKLRNWNTLASQANENITTPFFNLQQTGNATYSFVCTQINAGHTYLGTTNASALPGQQPFGYWAIYGCDLVPIAGTGTCPALGDVNTAGCPYFSSLISIPLSNGNGTLVGGIATPLPQASGSPHFNAYMQTAQWDTGFCVVYLQLNVNKYASTACLAATGALNAKNYQSVNEAINTGITFFSPAFAWILSIILLILGLGINFRLGGGVLGTGGTVGAGVNRQGTKLAQVLGLGLMIWIPFYSEFSPWFTSGFLPYGLDGATGVISIVLTAVYFGGVFWWSTQG